MNLGPEHIAAALKLFEQMSTEHPPRSKSRPYRNNVRAALEGGYRLYVVRKALEATALPQGERNEFLAQLTMLGWE